MLARRPLYRHLPSHLHSYFGTAAVAYHGRGSRARARSAPGGFAVGDTVRWSAGLALRGVRVLTTGQYPLPAPGGRLPQHPRRLRRIHVARGVFCGRNELRSLAVSWRPWRSRRQARVAVIGGGTRPVGSAANVGVRALITVKYDSRPFGTDLGYHVVHVGHRTYELPSDLTDGVGMDVVIGRCSRRQLRRRAGRRAWCWSPATTNAGGVDLLASVVRRSVTGSNCYGISGILDAAIDLIASVHGSHQTVPPPPVRTSPKRHLRRQERR